MTEFSPDWPLADTRRESMRDMLTNLARENEQLRGVIRDGTLAARHVLHMVEPGDSDQATALRALRGWVEQNLR